VLNRPITLVVGLVMILFIVWWQRPPASAEIARTALIMGTLVEIKGVGTDQELLDRAITAAFAVMNREEQLFSPEIETSQLSAINRATAAIEVDPEVIKVLRLGETIAQASHGAFDMGLGGIKKLWDLEGGQSRVPPEAEIKALLPPDSEHLVKIEGTRVARLDPRVQLDLGGIAKGYAVDQALAVLRKAGLASASVNAGGDIGLLGGHGERPWKIGIQHPRQPGALLATLELRDRAIVTSGDYERFFIQDGVRYHHIFDPQSGMPARDCQSVSVIAATVAEADALATAAFVLGPQAGLEFLQKYPDVEGLIVAADGTPVFTSGLKDRLQWP
jgi:thiamine biosynthesis lipoprotein